MFRKSPESKKESKKEPKKLSAVRPASATLSPSFSSPMETSIEPIEPGAPMHDAEEVGLATEHIKNVFEAFKSGDPSQIMQVVIELSSELSMAQESTIPSPLLDQLVNPLVSYLHMDESPDIILDIRPTIASRIIGQGGATLLCQKLQNIASFELVEHAIKALDKISIENAYSVLSGSALIYMAQLMEFFDFTQQKNVLRIMNVIIRAVSTSQDLETFVFPAIPQLAGVIRYRDNDDKSKEIMELGTTLLSHICELVPRVYGTRVENIAKLKAYVEEIAGGVLLDNLLETLFVAANSPGYAGLTPKSWSNVMHILRYMCKGSPKVCKNVISNGILNVLQGLLSTDAKIVGPPHPELPQIKEQIAGFENSDFISEGAVLLLDSLLPYKHLLFPPTKPDDIVSIEEYTIEAAKEKIIRDQGSALYVLGEAVFPRVVWVYENIGSATTKLYCLQIIDKIACICDPAAISKIMPPQSAGQFLYDNLSSNESLFACFGIRIAEMTLQKLAKIHGKYLKCMKREGVIEQIKLLQDYAYIEKKYSQKQDNGWLPINNPYVQHFLSYSSQLVEEPQLVPFASIEVSKGTKKVFHSGNNKPFSAKLMDYIYHSAAQILEYYDIMGEMKELKEAEDEFAACNKVVGHLESLLRLGVSGKKEEWAGLFQHIANLTISDSNFTTYEARSTSLFLNLYHALCETPTEYHKKIAAQNNLEETKAEPPEARVRTFVRTQREDLAQMVTRHTAFMTSFSHTTLGNRILLFALSYQK